MLYRFLCISLFILDVSAYALINETNNTIDSQFEAALLCKIDPIDGRDAKVIKQLNQQNVRVKNYATCFRVLISMGIILLSASCGLSLL